MPVARTARSIALAAVVVMAGLLGTACGGGGGDDEPAADETTTTTTTTTTPPPSTTTTTAEDGEGISELEALAGELLILPAELGAPAEDQGYVPATGDPCGAELDRAHPPDVQVGTFLSTANGGFVEEIRIYSDTDTAIAAYEAAVELETECRFADRSAVVGPTDVNDRVGADAAVLVTAADRGGNLHRVTTRVADAVVTFSLSGQVGFVLDLVEVSAFGVGKILAALEA